METITTSTKEILDRALELETGNELYLACSTEDEKDILYKDLKQRRLWFIEDNLARYEQVIIYTNTFDLHHNVVLMKRNIVSAFIKKADDISFH